MLFKIVPCQLVLAPVIWALAFLPAAAQEQRAKDGWDMLRNSLAEAGLQVTTEGIDEAGSGLVVNGVTVRPAAGGGELHLPSLGVEPHGDSGFAFTPSQGGRLELPETGVVELDFDGQVVFEQRPDGLQFSPAFERIEARFDGPAGYGDLDGLSARLWFEGVSGVIETIEDAQLSLSGALHAGLVAFSQGANDGQRQETAEIDDMNLRISIDSLETLSAPPDSIAAIFEQGFALEIGYDAAASRNSSRQALQGEELRFDGVSGYSESVLTLRDGRLDARGSGEDMQMSGNMSGGAGQISLDRIAAGFGLPLVMTDEMQDFGLNVSVEGVQASEETWLLLGSRSFADDTGDMSLELAGEGRWLVDPSEAQGTDSPIELAGIRLDGLSLRLGQAIFEGLGRFDTARDAGTLERAVTQGQGAFTFTLRGGEALLTRLGNEGILPADQAFLARMMLGGLARQVGEDHLESQVTINPGGQVLVNGMPLPF